MPELDPRLHQELREIIDRGLTSGEFLTRSKIDDAIAGFRERFGPAQLRNADGEALLRLMHGREDVQVRPLMYWLEFKNDDEFPGSRFGDIRGGTALKFGLYQRKEDNEWITGSNQNARVITKSEAIALTRQQRDELLAGEAEIARLPRDDTSDATYARLQSALERVAPETCDTVWARKYWSLLHADKLDDFHTIRYQRFHIFKMLQIPPGIANLLEQSGPRFVCAGRFISAARSFDVPVNTLTSALVKRNGPPRRYWKVGTQTGDTQESQWPAMLDGGFVSIGWPEQIPDLSKLIGQKNLKEQVRIMLAGFYDDPGTVTRKAGEVAKFAEEIAEGDLVLACEGQEILGVGRVRGDYEYDGRHRFPHLRPVDWLHLDTWKLPDNEGPRTTVFELGKYPNNILKLEQVIFQRKPIADVPRSKVAQTPSPADSPGLPLPPLDPFTARIDVTLRRKGQLILYGPPGTGKTYQARRIAHELAARRALRKSFSAGQLSEAEKGQINGPRGLVRMCTFHPGYGYEDFIEGFRPRTAGGGQMTFELRDGIFKSLCRDARQQPESHFYLIIDEINRGDLPRIFGELMTVIEHDKREISTILPLSGAPFAVPTNVFVIGTMNTSDRSISLLDTALRRRFGFIELMPDSKVLAPHNAGGIAFGPWLDALNARVRRHLKRDARNLQIGHAYLLPSPPIASIAQFTRILRDDIVPLLEEYCYDDFETLSGILGNDIVDAENGRIRDELFEPDQEDRLISALMFSEMQQATAGDPTTQVDGDGDGDGDSDGDDDSDAGTTA